MGRPADARKYICAPPSKRRNASPYQRDDAERPGIWRGPRRSPPRGLNRGTLFLVAIRLHQPHPTHWTYGTHPTHWTYVTTRPTGPTRPTWPLPAVSRR